MHAFFRDGRSEQRLREHYDLERELACRFLFCPAAGRAKCYSEVYSELFRSLPDHPQRSGVKKNERPRHIEKLAARLSSFFGGGKTFLEIGCGDAALSVQ